MESLIYMPSIKLTPTIEEFSIPKDFITIGDFTYIRLSRKPKGRSIDRKLINPETGQQILIYK